MMIYVAVITVLLFYQLMLIVAEDGGQLNKCNRGMQLPKTFYLPIAILVLAIAAFRVDIGYDFTAYSRLFDVIHKSRDTVVQISNTYNLELGYVWLNKFLPNFQSVVFWMAMIGVGIKLYYIYKWSDSRSLTLFMYFTGIFLTFDMGVIRQGVAIAMYLVVMDFCGKGQKIRAVLAIIFSCFFHLSSLIYFPIIFMEGKKLSRNKVYIIIAIASIFTFFNLSEFLVKLFLLTGNDILSTKVVYYSSLYTGNISASYLKRVVFLVVFTEFYQRHGFKNDREIRMFNSYFLCVLFMALFSSIAMLGGRGVTAFYFTQYFIFANIYKRANDKIWRILIVCVCVALSLFAMRSTIVYGNLSGQQLTPYTWIWSKL